MPLFHSTVLKLVAAGLALAALVTSPCLATPQEDAFLRAWTAHARAPENHKAVIQACQSVMDRSSTLGEFLPVVKTLAAWHLLADGKRSDAIRIFESALTSDKGNRPLMRHADIMARRWLTRLDMAVVEQALKEHYREHVEFPDSLAPLLNLPVGQAPPKSDRFDDPWVYGIKPFSKLGGVARQRYTLHSRSIGPRLSALRSLPLESYGGGRSATIISRKSASPLTIEFETTSEAGVQRSVATESGALSGGLRFLAMDSGNRFAILIDTDADYWVLATPVRSRQ